MTKREPKPCTKRRVAGKRRGRLKGGCQKNNQNEVESDRATGVGDTISKRKKKKGRDEAKSKGGASDGPDTQGKASRQKVSLLGLTA